MAEKLVKIVITFKCNVKGEGKKPGDVIELPESKANELVGIGRATKDLSWKPEKKEKPKADK